MRVHAFSTGKVKVTHNWIYGHKTESLRLPYALLDGRHTDWLPIFCWVVEHPEGMLLIDAGIPPDANKPIWFPPFMPLVQRAAPFEMSPEQTIDAQMQAAGLSPDDVRWLLVTHLHQDHDGCLRAFPNAEIMLARAEWAAAQGFAGRMSGYLTWRWSDLNPTLIDFDGDGLGAFAGSYTLTQAGDVQLVPTPGHSAGHTSVLVHDGDVSLLFAGDASYSQQTLIDDVVDGVGPDPAAQRDTHARILRYAAQHPTIYLPTHEWGSSDRLAQREVLALDA